MGSKYHKIVILGSSSPVKTNIIYGLLGNDYNPNEACDPEIGPQYICRTISRNHINGDLGIWGLGGESEGIDFIDHEEFLKRASKILLVYDVDVSETFVAVEVLANCLRESHNVVLLAYKKEGRMEVSEETARNFASNKNFEFMECNVNSGNCFDELLYKIISPSDPVDSIIGRHDDRCLASLLELFKDFQHLTPDERSRFKAEMIGRFIEDERGRIVRWAEREEPHSSSRVVLNTSIENPVLTGQRRDLKGKGPVRHPTRISEGNKDQNERNVEVTGRTGPGTSTVKGKTKRKGKAVATRANEAHAAETGVGAGSPPQYRSSIQLPFSEPISLTDQLTTASHQHITVPDSLGGEDCPCPSIGNPTRVKSTAAEDEEEVGSHGAPYSPIRENYTPPVGEEETELLGGAPDNAVGNTTMRGAEEAELSEGATENAEGNTRRDNYTAAAPVGPENMRLVPYDMNLNYNEWLPADAYVYLITVLPRNMPFVCRSRNYHIFRCALSEDVDPHDRNYFVLGRRALLPTEVSETGMDGGELLYSQREYGTDFIAKHRRRYRLPGQDMVVLHYVTHYRRRTEAQRRHLHRREEKARELVEKLLIEGSVIEETETRLKVCEQMVLSYVKTFK